MNTQQNIVCPTCNAKNTWRTDNSFKPFCSARCKLIDLGEWANEQRSIAGESLPQTPDNSVEEDM